MHAGKLAERKRGMKPKLGIPAMGMLDRELRQVRACLGMEPFHLDACVAEQEFRYNNRTTKDNLRTMGIASCGEYRRFQGETDLCRTNWQGDRGGRSPDLSCPSG